MKIFFRLLVLLSIIFINSCSDDDDGVVTDDKLVGTWNFEYAIVAETIINDGSETNFCHQNSYYRFRGNNTYYYEEWRPNLTAVGDCGRVISENSEWENIDDDDNDEEVIYNFGLTPKTVIFKDENHMYIDSEFREMHYKRF